MRKGREVYADLKGGCIASTDDDGWFALGGGKDLDLVESEVFLDLQECGESEGNRLCFGVREKEAEVGALAVDVGRAKAGGSAIEAAQDNGGDGGFGGVGESGEIDIEFVGWAFASGLCDALDVQFNGSGRKIRGDIEPFEGEFDLIAKDQSALLTFFEA